MRDLVVGGTAVVFYTKPRYTKDLDVWVEPSADNALRVMAALKSFGAPLEGVEAADFTNPKTVFQIGVEPNRVDIMSALPGLVFADAWEARCPSTYGGVPIHFLSRNHLIVNNRLVGRDQDLVDAKELERRRPKPKP